MFKINNKGARHPLINEFVNRESGIFNNTFKRAFGYCKNKPTPYLNKQWSRDFRKK